ncbi:zinc transporter ZntB [Actibacterium pelagium]|nr:zinc transporter ZntB [Actibacterium pelagium]
MGVADPKAGSRLRTEIGLDDLVVTALLAEETRPRCTPHGEGALINLRGVNSQHGAEPEDMVSVRLWLDHEKVVTCQFRELAAVGQMAEWIEGGVGPGTPGDFVVALADKLTEGMESVVDALDTELDDLEEEQAQDRVHELRETIADMRRTIVRLRRFIAPQRDALDVLIAETFVWQTEVQERRLKEIVDRITRLVEQLDTMHHRAAILQDFIAVRVAERLNSTMVLLSIVAGVFLPLSFVTGLLGMNVAGIPMATSQSAFLVISGVLVVIGVVTFLALWKLRSQ